MMGGFNLFDEWVISSGCSKGIRSVEGVIGEGGVTTVLFDVIASDRPDVNCEQKLLKTATLTLPTTTVRTIQ